jgi:hypothetical protein
MPRPQQQASRSRAAAALPSLRRAAEGRACGQPEAAQVGQTLLAPLPRAVAPAPVPEPVVLVPQAALRLPRGRWGRRDRRRHLKA